MARFIARRWFVEHGNTIVPGHLHTLLGDMLPQKLLGGVSAKSRDQWTQAVIAAFDKMGLASNKYTRKRVNFYHLREGGYVLCLCDCLFLIRFKRLSAGILENILRANCLEIRETDKPWHSILSPDL